MLRYELINVGRDHFNGIIEVASEEQLCSAVKKAARLMSRDIAIMLEDDEGTEGTIIVGGMRPVGKIKALMSTEEQAVTDAIEKILPVREERKVL